MSYGRTQVLSLYGRIADGIDWGRPGPWPPDAITALHELVGLTLLGTPNVTSVAADSDNPKNGGSKPEADQ